MSTVFSEQSTRFKTVTEGATVKLEGVCSFNKTSFEMSGSIYKKDDNLFIGSYGSTRVEMQNDADMSMFVEAATQLNQLITDIKAKQKEIYPGV